MAKLVEADVELAPLNYSLGAAYNIDFSRPIGRLDWFRGFGSKMHHVDAIVSPILICLPDSTEWSRRVGFKLQHQVSVDFPMRRVSNSLPGTLYYLDDFEAVGAESSTRIPDGVFTHERHAKISRHERRAEQFVFRPSTNACVVFCDDMPDRIRAALEMHAPVPCGLGIFAVTLDEKSLLLVPCSRLAFQFYAPVVRRDMGLLFGEKPRDHPMCFDGLRFHAAQSVSRVYPYRYHRSIAQASIEAESLLCRALAFRSGDGGLPFLIRLPTTGRVRIVGGMYRHEDTMGTIYVAVSPTIGPPVELHIGSTQHPTSYAPYSYGKHVWLSAAGHHAQRARRRDDVVYDIVHRFRHFSSAKSFFAYWGSRHQRGLDKWADMFLRRDDPSERTGS